MPKKQTALSVIQPAQSLTEYDSGVNALIDLVKERMKEGIDYGVIPGTEKKSLYKPGAEKIAKYFGISIEQELVKEIEDFDQGLFYYKYKATARHMASGTFVGSAERACHSREKKYSVRTVPEKFATDEEKSSAVDKKYNKTYKSYDYILAKGPYEVADQINTIMAMAQKRAMVAVVQTCTAAGQIFLEDAPDKRPMQSITKEEDPERYKYYAALYSAGSERGFEPQKLKSAAYSRFNVQSMTELSNEELAELTDELVTTWDIVKKGEKPRKLSVVAHEQ